MSPTHSRPARHLARLAPLTPRETAVLQYLRRRAAVAAGGVAALIGVLACASVQPLCFRVPYGTGGRPEEGSSRAGYCNAIAHWYRWLVFPAATVVVGCVLIRLLRGKKHRYAWTMAVLCVLGAVHLAIVGSMSDAVLVG
jgi:hypothetical protein